MKDQRYTDMEVEMYCVGKSAGIAMMSSFFGWKLMHADPENNYWVLQNTVNQEIKVITADPSEVAADAIAYKQ